MTFLRTLFTTEPVLVTGVVASVLAVLASFQLPITDAQTKAIIGLAGAVMLLGSALIGRSQAFAPATVDSIIRTVQAGPGIPASDVTPAAVPADAPSGV